MCNFLLQNLTISRGTVRGSRVRYPKLPISKLDYMVLDEENEDKSDKTNHE
jgi:hypothetical protein